jgi:hypothetical protein
LLALGAALEAARRQTAQPAAPRRATTRDNARDRCTGCGDSVREEVIRIESDDVAARTVGVKAEP